MTKVKKSAVTSISGELKVLAKAQAVDLRPPASVPMLDRDKPFWASILAARARSEWNDHDLEFAAMLARAMGQLENEQRLLEQEGTVIATATGNLTANPRVTVVHGLHAQVKGCRQSLGIHSRGQGGEARDVEKRRTFAKNIENAVLSGGDDLLN
jgi:hypothetical protein